MHLTGMRFGGVPPFTAPVEFGFDQRVNVFAGANATGRSRLLSAIEDHPGRAKGTATVPGHNVKRRTGMVSIYCLRCRGKKEVEGARAVIMKNGRPAIQGVCPECGARVFRIGEVGAGESLG